MERLLVLGVPVVLGVAVGYLSGGRLSRLLATRLRAVWLLWLAALIQAGQYVGIVRHLLEVRLDVPMLGVVFGLVAAWLTINLVLMRWCLRLAILPVAVGTALNGLAIALNGRMPYAAEAAAHAGLRSGLQTPKNAPATVTSSLPYLGDLIPIAPLRTVISVGDVLICFGVVAMIVFAMRSERDLTHRDITEGGEL